MNKRIRTKTWPYGTRKQGTVIEVVKAWPIYRRVVMITGDDGEGYILVGGNQPLVEVGDRVTFEFRRGGPTGGHWAILPPPPDEWEPQG